MDICKSSTYLTRKNLIHIHIISKSNTQILIQNIHFTN